MDARIAVILCAAGASSRFGGKVKKPFIKINDKVVLIRSIELFSENPLVSQIILAISEQDQEKLRINHGAFLDFSNVEVTLGGKERFDTVRNAMAVVRSDITHIAVHDAARCCAKPEWVSQVFQKAINSDAAMLASRVVSTIKRVSAGVITDTVDRSDLWEAQTPQVFKKDLLERAYNNLVNLDKSKISDDSMLVEALGCEVSVVETDNSNIKITTQADVVIAQGILNSREKMRPKGYMNPFQEDQW